MDDQAQDERIATPKAASRPPLRYSREFPRSASCRGRAGTAYLRSGAACDAARDHRRRTDGVSSWPHPMGAALCRRSDTFTTLLMMGTVRLAGLLDMTAETEIRVPRIAYRPSAIAVFKVHKSDLPGQRIVLVGSAAKFFDAKAWARKFRCDSDRTPAPAVRCEPDALPARSAAYVGFVTIQRRSYFTRVGVRVALHIGQEVVFQAAPHANFLRVRASLHFQQRADVK